MGITISFENDTGMAFEVAILAPLGNVTIASKRMAPGTLWIKTDEGLSASMVYSVRLYQLAHLAQPSQELTGQQPLLCKVQAPASKGEVRYKLSDIVKGESKPVVISSATAQEIMTDAVTTVGNTVGQVTKSAMKTVGIATDDDAEKEDDETKKENLGIENDKKAQEGDDDDDDEEEEEEDDAPEEPPTFTKLELRMLKERHPKTHAEREAFKSAIAKKHHIKRKPKKKKKHAKASETRELLSENQRLAVERGKQLDKNSKASEDVEDEAKKAMLTFKQLRIQHQNEDPLSFLKF
uniref:Uncharacterized protein n=1 Tax=Lotharella oceanica TaxID=641309 RepID=A0A7S2TFI9_9EUKA|mmetsp:Transcript_11624/g.22377  ORF Transcript_11624/g.22377 Transcript_11624/m.22377 type:complete len:295 (+) Transcript_11624:82-966(+)